MPQFTLDPYGNGGSMSFSSVGASFDVVPGGTLDVLPEIFHSKIHNVLCDLLMFRSGCLHGEILD